MWCVGEGRKNLRDGTGCLEKGVPKRSLVGCSSAMVAIGGQDAARYRDIPIIKPGINVALGDIGLTAEFFYLFVLFLILFFSPGVLERAWRQCDRWLGKPRESGGLLSLDRTGAMPCHTGTVTGWLFGGLVAACAGPVGSERAQTVL